MASDLQDFCDYLLMARPIHFVLGPSDNLGKQTSLLFSFEISSSIISLTLIPPSALMTKHYTAPPFALGVSKRVLKDPSTDSSSGNVAVSAYGAVVAAGLLPSDRSPIQNRQRRSEIFQAKASGISDTRPGTIYVEAS